MHSYSAARHLLVIVSLILPGFLLSLLVAAGAYSIATMSGLGWLSPMITAVMIGMIINRLIGTSEWAQPGLGFSMRPLLRFAVMLLGVQLSLSQITELGVDGFLIVIASLACTFVFTVFAGRALGVDARLAELIAAGTSICGASAVVAANTVTRAREDHDLLPSLFCPRTCRECRWLVFRRR